MTKANTTKKESGMKMSRYDGDSFRITSHLKDNRPQQ